MPFLYRTAIIVSRKQPYIDWANSRRGKEDVTLPPALARKREIYLGPYTDLEQTLDEAVEVIWREIFAEELFAWSTDESEWPPDRSREMFDAWFETELADSIVDLVPEEPLTEEDVELVDVEVASGECAWCGAELADANGRTVPFELTDPDVAADRLGRVLQLSVGRGRVVSGVVTPRDWEHQELGVDLLIRACGRLCEKHLLKDVPRALRELTAFRRRLGRD